MVVTLVVAQILMFSTIPTGSSNGLFVSINSFGLAHFIDPQDTLVLEPRWLPWHVFWAYFFGCTFIAAGIAVVIGLLARLAAALLVVQLALFTGLVWIPVVAAGSENAFQRNEAILSVTLTAAAWVWAESYRGVRWFALTKPLSS